MKRLKIACFLFHSNIRDKNCSIKIEGIHNVKDNIKYDQIQLDKHQR